MKGFDIPLNGDELIAIGNTVNEVTERLRMLEDGTDEAGLMSGVREVVVEILRPDTHDEVVGEVRFHGDGWWSYYPRAVGE